MKSMKFRTVILALMLIVIVFLAAGQAEAFWDKHGLEISYGTPDIKVDNMALEIRDVPIHDDDDYVSASKAGPVEQESYDTAGTVAIAWLMRKDLTETTRAGLKIKWIIYPMHGDNALRNYTNAVGTEERGYGAALTFVGVGKGGIFSNYDDDWYNIFLNITPELFLEKALSEKKDWIIGSSISYFRFLAINGWDRYDKLETNETFTLAHVTPVAAYIKYKIVEIGVKYPLVSMTDIGEESGAEVNPSAYIALNSPW